MLSHSTRKHTKESLTHASESSRYGFDIKGLGFILSSEISSEIIKDVSICSIPATQHWFNGVINIRGQLVPVFDLKMLLFKEKTESHLCLLLDKGAKAVAIRIQNLPQLIEHIQQAEANNPLIQQLTIPTFVKDFITHYYISDLNPWLEFDKHAFFLALREKVLIHS